MKTLLTLAVLGAGSLLALAVLGAGNLLALAEEKNAKTGPAEEVQIVEAVDCSLGKDVRRVEVLTRRAGCSAQYSKFGTSQEIASARNGVEACRAALKKTRKTLEGAGYLCK